MGVALDFHQSAVVFCRSFLHAISWTVCYLVATGFYSSVVSFRETDLSRKHPDASTYEIKASTLAKETEEYSLNKAYIKIDVEGFEVNIIDSSKEIINSQRAIVGFEALSKESALNCTKLFKEYSFYCARFDFLEPGGALMNSFIGMLKGLIMGANIEVIKLEDITKTELENFSQIYSVPNEKTVIFENAILDYCLKNPILNLAKISTWLT